jgi:hypothetical protein
MAGEARVLPGVLAAAAAAVVGPAAGLAVGVRVLHRVQG